MVKRLGSALLVLLLLSCSEKSKGSQEKPSQKGSTISKEQPGDAEIAELSKIVPIVSEIDSNMDEYDIKIIDTSKLNINKEDLYLSELLEAVAYFDSKNTLKKITLYAYTSGATLGGARNNFYFNDNKVICFMSENYSQSNKQYYYLAGNNVYHQASDEEIYDTVEEKYKKNILQVAQAVTQGAKNIDELIMSSLYINSDFDLKFQYFPPTFIMKEKRTGDDVELNMYAGDASLAANLYATREFYSLKLTLFVDKGYKDWFLENTTFGKRNKSLKTFAIEKLDAVPEQLLAENPNLEGLLITIEDTRAE